jgi:hypothetical protein
MKLLAEIPSFPAAARETLETEYGIESAEAFYVHALKGPAGLRTALRISQPELDRLVRIAEGYLSPDYIERCRQPAAKHPRGVILDGPPRANASSSAPPSPRRSRRAGLVHRPGASARRPDRSIRSRRPRDQSHVGLCHTAPRKDHFQGVPAPPDVPIYPRSYPKTDGPIYPKCPET